MIVKAKLINPQIIMKDGQKWAFDNTLVYFDDETGDEIERQVINLPYAMPDPEIEALVKDMAVAKAAELEIIQDEQADLQWDWPEWDN